MGQARVEASVDIPPGSRLPDLINDAGGVVEDGELLIVRNLSAQGRSRAYVGGAGVPASLLATVSDELVAIHGQSDQHRLLRPAQQRAALDRFAGPKLAAIVDEFSPAFARLRAIEHHLEKLRTTAQERARELDLLTFGLDDIAAVDPEPDELERLVIEERRLAHAESLVVAAERAHETLAGNDGDTDGARSRVARALSALREAQGHDAGLDELAQRVHEVSVLLDDVGGDLAGYASGIDIDPARLANVQERRAALTGLLRKYGPDLADVLSWRQRAESRLNELGSDDTQIEALEVERLTLGPAVLTLAHRLTELRTEAAVRLGTLVTGELQALSMQHARLAVEVTARADDSLREHGLDDVEFLFTANNGMSPRPLNKGASGGELSRLMLALEVVLIDRATVPTLVFDEVDAGIGGKAAVEVGRRLARLSAHAQVLAVTHLPQVAAFADHHFRVQKDDDGSVTSSSVIRLKGDQRVDELARMLAGQEDSASAQAHARELLALAAVPALK